ncbi:MAG: DUF4411 family protein [Clostridiales bacterium]|jgi:hypothetical protein|nr:DUF4411 family protein [Clostridiales bacterium]
MTHKKYAIDACALIEASKVYPLDKKSFAHVWNKFSEMFEEKSLISSIEVFDELKDKNLQTWMKKHKNCFLPLSTSVQVKTTEILASYPELVKIRSKHSSSNGDPFLIATAIENGCVVVTNERLGDENTKDYRIPNICKKYNTPCISLNDFIDEIFE